MPTFKVTTKKSRVKWQSPDGKRVLSEVTLDVNGEEAIANTYSEAIAHMGWEGEVETYEKPDNRGNVETFVKQPQKENPYRSGGGGEKKPYVPRDDASIKAQFAIKAAIAWLNGSPKDDAESVGLIEPLAVDFYNMVDRVKNAGEPVEEELTKEALNAVFGDDENFTVEGEKVADPWKKNPLN